MPDQLAYLTVSVTVEDRLRIDRPHEEVIGAVREEFALDLIRNPHEQPGAARANGERRFRRRGVGPGIAGKNGGIDGDHGWVLIQWKVGVRQVHADVVISIETRIGQDQAGGACFGRKTDIG